MNCPVCKRSEISEFSTVCSSCKSDLVPFRLLESIESDAIDYAKRKVALEGDALQWQKRHATETGVLRSRVNRLFLCLMLLPLMHLMCAKKPVPAVTKITVQNDSLNYYKQMYEDLQSSKVREVKYVVRKGDILENIALLFFNNKKAALQISKDNHFDKNDRHSMSPGDTIIIKYH